MDSFFCAEPCGLDYIDPSAIVLGPKDGNSGRTDDGRYRLAEMTKRMIRKFLELEQRKTVR